MKENMLGIDVGGTKCAIIYGIKENDELHIIDKKKFDTTTVDETIAKILCETEKMMQLHQLTPTNTKAIGICCGGPLNSETGIVMSPPNLPGWDNIPIVAMVEKKTGIKTSLHNDANACALAEWKFGAGTGTKNMVFLTFGTGLGAGLILNGKLYTGTNDNAGEKLQTGQKVEWCTLQELDQLTARKVAEEAAKGDKLAQSIYETSAIYLGKGLSIVIDILNPEVIVIGGIYTRNKDMMEPIMQKIIDQEALSCANRVCKVKPAALGEQIGDYAALSVAANLTD
ncbi:MAG: ROK family protein [Bacteroides sp.]|nr:ROK family protein [Bacteroides sp.]